MFIGLSISQLIGTLYKGSW